MPRDRVGAQDGRMDSAGKASIERTIQRFRAGQLHAAADTLVVEEPLELRAHGKSLAVIMRTPGHDGELLRGLLHAEGLIRAGEENWSLTQKSIYE